MLVGSLANSQHQARFGVFLYEAPENRQCSPQKVFNFSGAAVSYAKPNEFRWMPDENAALLKVEILGNNREPVVSRVVPDFRIFRAF